MFILKTNIKEFLFQMDLTSDLNLQSALKKLAKQALERAEMLKTPSAPPPAVQVIWLHLN